MKKILSILTIGFLLTGCGGDDDKKDSKGKHDDVQSQEMDSAEVKTEASVAGAPVVSGTIKDGAGRRIQLQRMPLGSANYTTIDEVVINEDGTFKLHSDVDFLEFYMIKVLPSSAPNHLAYVNLILDKNENVTLNAEADDILNTYTVSGSEESANLFDYFNSYVRPFQYSIDSMKPLYPGIETNQALQEKFNSDLEPLRAKNLKKLDNLVVKYQNSPVSYFAQLNKINELRITGGKVTQEDLAILDKAVGVVGNRMPMSITPTQATASANQLRKSVGSDVGQPAPEIALPDPEGKIRKLSDLKGKVVMIDFWASWCGPCRKQNPHVVSVYNKYKNEGFEIFSVSLDKQKEPWVRAIQSDGLIWPNHVSDLKFWNSVAAAAYGVQSIPRVVLVDKEGNIIKSDVSPSELDSMLASIFGF